MDNEETSPSRKVLPKLFFDKFGQEILIFKRNLNNINFINKVKEIVPQFNLKIILSLINSGSKKINSDSKKINSESKK